ncbi:MAG TPA: CotH kinase family protein, partial [Verrucomicrobiae bacterium]
PFFGGDWWPWLFSDPDFWQQWVDRWQELRRTHFALTNMDRLIDQLTGELREAQPREYQKWGLQPHGGTYQGEIDHMKDWLSNRVDFIDRQLVQPPRFKSEGGRVAPGFALKLSARASATIYYTLDGSDPRLSQGGISSNALVYSNSIPINSSVHVCARTHNVNIRQVGGPPLSTPWSSPASAKFEMVVAK